MVPFVETIADTRPTFAIEYARKIIASATMVPTP